MLNNTHKHPVIYLTNIKHEELQAIIQFIYLGKATFYQDKMDDFITAAKDLKVKEIYTGIDLENETIGETSFVEQQILSSEHQSEDMDSTQGNNKINDCSSLSVKKYSCKDCTYTSNDSGNLKRHHDAKHKGLKSQAKYHCPECDKVFNDSSNMKKHYNNFHLGLRYRCDDCNTIYKDINGHRKHMKSFHEGIIYNCEQDNCEKSFTRAYHLKSHIEDVHHGKTYPCSNCDFTANSKPYLKQHMQYKYEQLAYQCDYCDHHTIGLSKLKLHVDRIHVGIKDKCSLDKCGSEFKEQDLFVDHVKNFHNQNPKPCPKCDFYAYNKVSLNVHKQKMHNI